MGNKPHRIKKLQQKALRKAAQLDVSKNRNKEAYKAHMVSNLKPFNMTTAKEMLMFFKKDIQHIHLKHKPHHSKRTTPGSVDAENPQVMTGHDIHDRSMKKWHAGDTQKSADFGRKHFQQSWKKAA